MDGDELPLPCAKVGQLIFFDGGQDDLLGEDKTRNNQK